MIRLKLNEIWQNIINTKEEKIVEIFNKYLLLHNNLESISDKKKLFLLNKKIIH